MASRSARGRGRVFGAAPVWPTTLPSASMGPFSNTAYITGDTQPAFDDEETFVLLFEMPAAVSAGAYEFLWCCENADLTKGFSIIAYGDAGSALIAVRPGGFYFKPLTWRIGLNCLVLTRKAAGEIRYSLNGAAAAQWVASAAASTVDVTCVQQIGALNGAYATEDWRMLEVAHIGVETSDADMALWSNVVNEDDRYHLSSAVREHASLVSNWSADRDWDGGASTVSGLGSAPTTWTLTDTIVRNTIESEWLLTERQAWWHDSHTYEDETTHNRRNIFARARIITDATRIVVDAYNTIFTAFPAYAGVGVYVGGAYDDQALANKVNASTAKDLAFAAGSKTLDFVDGLQTNPPGTVLGTYTTRVRIPKSASYSVVLASPPADRLVVYGDSIASGGTATIGVRDAWPLLVRGDYSGGVLVESWGYRSLYDDANTAGLRAAFVAQLVALCDGTSSNTLWLAIGTNDYGLSKWTAAAFGVAYAALLDDLHTALPALTIYCQTPLTRGTETANGSGSTLPEYRAEIATAVSTRGAYCTLVDGTTLTTYPGTDYDADTIHLTTAGHASYKAAVKAVLGY